jgi:U3 small nucleolar RNA-associated protein 14
MGTSPHGSGLPSFGRREHMIDQTDLLKSLGDANETVTLSTARGDGAKRQPPLGNSMQRRRNMGACSTGRFATYSRAG